MKIRSFLPVLALIAIVTSGCANPSPSGAPTSPGASTRPVASAETVGPRSSGAPASSDAPSPSSIDDADAFAAAVHVYRNYVDALNQIDLSDPESFEGAYRWTTGDLNEADRASFTRMSADGWQLHGAQSIVSIERAADPAGSWNLALAVCLDVSATSVVDEHGDSVTNPDRRDVQPVLVTFQPIDDPLGVRVAGVEGRDGPPACSGQ